MFPLSRQQELIWLHQQIAPDSRAYYFTAIVELRGELNVAALRRALAATVDQYDALRLRLPAAEGGIPGQEVAPEVEVTIVAHDLRGDPDAAARSRRLISDHASRKYELDAAPLARWLLLRRGDEYWQLVHSEHHLIHDGRSFGTFLDTLFGHYAGEVSGAAYQPVEAPSYADYVAFSQSPEVVAAAAEAVGWWTQELTDAPFGVEFPGIGNRRAERRSFAGAQFRQILPAELMTAVTVAGKAGGYTPFTALFSAFAELCRRHSGQAEVVIGTALPNRPARFDATVGMLVNSVPLRIPAVAGGSGHAHAQALLRKVFDALDHQAAPIQDIVKAVGASAATMDNPLFNVMFSMHDKPLPRRELPGLTVEVHGGLNERSARFDLDLVVLPPDTVFGAPGRHEYTVVWDYSTQRFAESDIALLAGRFEHLLRGYTADPLRPLGSLALTDPEPLPRISPEPAAAGLGVVAERSGPAVIHGAETVTSTELDRRVANRMDEFRRAGLGDGDVVAGRFSRGIETIVTLLACLRAGLVFAPLSVALPPGRLATVLSRLRPALVLVTPEEVAGITAKGVRLGDQAKPDRILRAGDQGVRRPSAAYIIHTSGTTGVPKAVAVPRSSLAAVVAALSDRYRLSSDDVVLQFTDPAFDVYLEEVLPTLAAGGCLVVPRHGAPTGAELGALVLARGVSVLNLPTSYALAIAEELNTALTGRAHDLRLVVVGGDRLTVTGLGKLTELDGQPRIMNAYGVTEAVITSTVLAADELEPTGRADVPIGTALAGVDVRIVTEDRQDVPSGVPGEIAIAVPGEPAGYLNAEPADEQRFARLPSRPDTVFYLTGDRGYRDAAGRVTFLGRIDRQVKVNGHRLELEEIELAVRAVRPGKDCAVTVDRSAGGDVLVGFLAGDTGDLDGLEDALVTVLPRYAVPRRWAAVARIPRQPGTGKVIFDELTIPPASGPEEGSGSSADDDPESSWLRAFREVLKRDDVGADADFFRMGGHSLLVFRLLSRYEELTGWRPPTSLVFQHSTPRRLEAESIRLREVPGG